MSGLKRIYDELEAKLDGIKTGEELVFSCGNESARIMLIGEAPGKDEVLQKKPFVGKAGKNLDEFLELSGLDREELFITNVVKFRPYKVGSTGRLSNRPPTDAEIRMCEDCLKKEIDFVAPEYIITLGNTALFSVLGNKNRKITELHGKILEADGLKIYPLYHPASIIYRRELKPVYEADVLRIKEFI